MVVIAFSKFSAALRPFCVFRLLHTWSVNLMTSESDPVQQNIPTPDVHREADAQADQTKPHHCEITCKTESNFWDNFKTGAEILGILLLAVYTFYTIKMYGTNKQAT